MLILNCIYSIIFMKKERTKRRKTKEDKKKTRADHFMHR